MNKIYIIGIDIGGTNTDGVIVDKDNRIIAAAKVTTTATIEEGFKILLSTLLDKASLPTDSVTGIFVGTTHGTNAILQQRDLFKVGVLRITSNCGLVLPPCASWPLPIKNAIFAGFKIVDGGYECDGKTIANLNVQQIHDAIIKLLDAGVESFAVVGTFSPINAEQEREVASIISSLNAVPISLSHQLGGIGFIERENSTILNAALKKCMQFGFAALQQAITDLGFQCPLLLTQNNGTILSLQEALEFPVLTISAGPTNSFVGSTKLAGLNNAVVADIGGTSTDIGIVLNGFARRSLHTSSIGGIKLNFSMPDVLATALGGGSIISFQENDIVIGPESCARLLREHAYAFGGATLTLTDAALKQAIIQIDGADTSCISLTTLQAQAILDKAQAIILSTAQIMKGMHDIPLILAGGGSALFKTSALAEHAIIPEHADVANAYGAALAEISGTIDTVVSLEYREKTLHTLTEQAIEQAIVRGALEQTIRVVEQIITPYHYIPKNLVRIKITVAGKRVIEGSS